MQRYIWRENAQIAPKKQRLSAFSNGLHMCGNALCGQNLRISGLRFSDPGGFVAVYFPVSDIKLNIAVHLHSGSCGDKLTDDNIFLKSEQRVALALHCGFGENFCGLLEGCGGQEGVGGQGCLGDTEEHRLALCLQLGSFFGMSGVICFYFFICGGEFGNVNV